MADKDDKTTLQRFLQTTISDFRTRHRLSQERMAELLHVAPRSYIDQEHGKYSFSALSLVFFLQALDAENEMLPFLQELQSQFPRR